MKQKKSGESRENEEREREKKKKDRKMNTQNDEMLCICSDVFPLLLLLSNCQE